MQHRLGRCDACRASYEIPATYLPRFARCRLCRGMVRIGRAGGEEPWRPMPLGSRARPAGRAGEPSRGQPAPEREHLLPRVGALTLAPLTAELAFDEPLATGAWALADVLDGATLPRATLDEPIPAQQLLGDEALGVELDFGAGLS